MIRLICCVLFLGLFSNMLSAVEAPKDAPAPADLEATYTGILTIRDRATGQTLQEKRALTPILPRPQASKDLAVISSNLSPFVVIHNEGPRTLLFQGLEAHGLSGPTHLAIRDNHQNRVLSTANPIDPSGMTEAWMLFFFNGGTGWDKIPNAPYPIDVPILVVLQHLPKSIKPAGGGLELTFEKDSGYIAIVPFFGTSLTKAADTAAWKTTLPEPVFQRLRLLAEISREIPIAVTEQFKLNPRGDKLLVRNRFDFLSIDDDWKTGHKKIAPLEYAAALAWKNKFRLLAVQGAVTDLDLPVGGGLLAGVEGEEISYTLTGLLRYVNQVEQPKAIPADHPLLAEASKNPAAKPATVQEIAADLAAVQWDILCASHNLPAGSLQWGAGLDSELSASVRRARQAARAGDEESFRFASYRAAKGLLWLWAMGMAYPAHAKDKNVWPVLPESLPGAVQLFNDEPVLRFIKDRMSDYGKRSVAQLERKAVLDAWDVLMDVPVKDRQAARRKFWEENGGIKGHELEIIRAGVEQKYAPLLEADSPLARADSFYHAGLAEPAFKSPTSPSFVIERDASGFAMLSWPGLRGPRQPQAGSASLLPLCGIRP